MALRPIVFSAALTCLAVTVANAGPSDVVRQFYTTQLGNEADPSTRDLFTDPARAKLDANDRTVETGELGCVDFGLATDAQDFDGAEIASTLVLDEAISGTSARVTAQFTNFGGQRMIVWTLRNVDGDWLVSDIASPENDWQLSQFDCEN